MLTTVALMAALSLAPGQSGQLTLTHVRNTHGTMGPTRADSKILPGDSVCLSFDIEGMKADKGKVQYGIGFSISDKAGKMVYRKAASAQEADVQQGSSSVPAQTKIDVGLDQPPGQFTLKVTVTDRATNAKQSVSRRYEVLPKAFGLVRLTTTNDPDGSSPAAAFRQGKPGWINFAAVGFGHDSMGQPNLSVTMQVLNENGQPALAKPASGTLNKDQPAKAGAAPMQFEFLLGQTGKFKVILAATDRITGKEATLSFPIRVVSMN